MKTKNVKLNVSHSLVNENVVSECWRNTFNSLKTYTYENVPFNGTPSNCKYI